MTAIGVLYTASFGNCCRGASACTTHNPRTVPSSLFRMLITACRCCRYMAAVEPAEDGSGGSSAQINSLGVVCSGAALALRGESNAGQNRHSQGAYLMLCPSTHNAKQLCLNTIAEASARAHNASANNSSSTYVAFTAAACPAGSK